MPRAPDHVFTVVLIAGQWTFTTRVGFSFSSYCISENLEDQSRLYIFLLLNTRGPWGPVNVFPVSSYYIPEDFEDHTVELT